MGLNSNVLESKLKSYEILSELAKHGNAEASLRLAQQNIKIEKWEEATDHLLRGIEVVNIKKIQ